MASVGLIVPRGPCLIRERVSRQLGRIHGMGQCPCIGGPAGSQCRKAQPLEERPRASFSGLFHFRPFSNPSSCPELSRWLCLEELGLCPLEWHMGEEQVGEGLVG